MRTSFLFLLFFFCLHFTNAQYRTCELKLKTGETLQVLGKLKGSHEFKYKKFAKDKPKKIHFSEIEYVKLVETRNKIRTFKYFRIARENKSRIMEEVIVGDVSLYIISVAGVGMMSQPGFPMMMDSGESVSYYVKRPHNTEVILLEEPASTGKRFRRVATAFFADCKALVEKIKNKEFKAKHIEDIVRYYNEECD